MDYIRKFKDSVNVNDKKAPEFIIYNIMLSVCVSPTYTYKVIPGSNLCRH